MEHYDVFIMNPDGSGQVNLTQHPADDLQAVWSPRGDQILFVSDQKGGIDDLYLMNPDGSNVRRVFKGNNYTNKSNPTWSPDGNQIAYSAIDWNGSRSTVYVCDFTRRKRTGTRHRWQGSSVVTRWERNRLRYRSPPYIVSISAHTRENYSYVTEQYNGNASPLGRR